VIAHLLWVVILNLPKKNIREIIEKVKASETRDVRFAVVAYKDHGDEYVCKVFDWTSKTSEAFNYVSQLSPSGGGDTPEAVAEALDAINKLNYRKTATRICVFVADAPPHGLGQGDDSYPNGSPNGHDPIAIVNKLVEKEVIIYSVGCEPQIGNPPCSRDFYKAIAAKTGGKYVSLGNASLLSKVIIGGAEEEIALEKLAKTMQEEEKQIRSENKDISNEEVYKKVTENLDKKGVKCAALRYDDYGDSAPTEESKYMAKCEKISDVRSHYKNAIPPVSNVSYDIDSSHMSYSGSTASAPTGIISKISSFFSFSKPAPAVTTSAMASPMYAPTPTSLEEKTSAPVYHDYASQTAETVYDKNVSYDQVDRVLSRKAKANYY